MSIKNFTYLAFFTIVFATVGCKKLEPPVVPEDEPDFMTSFFIGSQDVGFVAGENNYYMFTDFEKSGDNLFSFTGELRNQFCTSNCANSLRIKIFDLTTREENTVNINESILLNSDYDFAMLNGAANEDTIYYTRLTAELPPQAGPNISFDWEINGQNFNTQTVELTDNNSPSISACLQTNDADNACTGKTCRSIGFNELLSNECFGQLVIADLLPELDSVNLTVLPNLGSTLTNIQWSTGETTDTIGVSTNGVYSYTGNTENCAIEGSGVLNGDLSTTNDVFFCTPRIRSEFSQEFIPNLENSIGKVIIEYRDASGTLYNSAWIEQSNLSSFRITDIDEYERNEQDQATARLNVQFTVNLASETGEILEIVEGNGQIGVAFPD